MFVSEEEGKEPFVLIKAAGDLTPEISPTPTSLPRPAPVLTPTALPTPESRPTAIPTAIPDSTDLLTATPLPGPTMIVAATPTPSPTPTPAGARLTLNTITAQRGEMVTFNFSLFNGEIPYTGFDASILFPEGITVKEISSGELLAEGFTIESQNIMENWMTVAASSAANTFSGDGVLLTISIEIGADVPDGEHPIRIKTSTLFDTDGFIAFHTSYDGMLKILPDSTPTPAPQPTTTGTPTVTHQRLTRTRPECRQSPRRLIRP